METSYPQMLDRDGLTSFHLDNTREKSTVKLSGVAMLWEYAKKKLLKVKSRTRSRSLPRISVKVPVLSLSAY